MLLVESSRLIFGVSSRGGLGQEGQMSNKKHKQAKYQFSEQTSSPFSSKWEGIGETIQLALYSRAPPVGLEGGEGVYEQRNWYRIFW